VDVTGRYPGGPGTGTVPGTGTIPGTGTVTCTTTTVPGPGGTSTTVTVCEPGPVCRYVPKWRLVSRFLGRLCFRVCVLSMVLDCRPPGNPDPETCGELPKCSEAYPARLPHPGPYEHSTLAPEGNLGTARGDALDEVRGEEGDYDLQWYNERAATEGPCPGVGVHYEVRSGGPGGPYRASIVCCPTCKDDYPGPGELALGWSCGVVWH